MAPANADDILKQMLGELLNSYAAVRVFTPSETQPAGTAADTNNTVAATAMRLWKGAVGTIGSRQQDGDALVLHPMWMRDSGDAPSSTSSSPSPKIYMQEGLVALLGLSYGEVTNCDSARDGPHLPYWLL